MSIKIEISEMYLRCTVDTQQWCTDGNPHPYLWYNNFDQVIYSSDFHFKGGLWKIECYKGQLLQPIIVTPHPIESSFYGLRLYKSSGKHPHLLNVRVYLEGSKNGLLPKSSSFTRDQFEKAKHHCIWEKSEQEILEVVPDFRLRRVLKLIVVLQPEHSPSRLLSSSAEMASLELQSLSDDFSRLLVQGTNSDVEFQCGDKFIKAHAAIVSARSEVIANMLETDKIEGRTRVVKIPDLKPDVFEKFLRYLYTGKLEGLDFELALRLFEVGDQYAVNGLAKRCSEYFMEHLSDQNACDVLPIVDAHSKEGLVNKVVDYMIDRRFPVFYEHWEDFCDKHPRLANKVLNRCLKALLE